MKGEGLEFVRAPELELELALELELSFSEIEEGERPVEAKGKFVAIQSLCVQLSKNGDSDMSSDHCAAGWSHECTQVSQLSSKGWTFCNMFQ